MVSTKVFKRSAPSRSGRSRLASGAMRRGRTPLDDLAKRVLKRLNCHCRRSAGPKKVMVVHRKWRVPCEYDKTNFEEVGYRLFIFAPLLPKRLHRLYDITKHLRRAHKLGVVRLERAGSW
jgi:hypothetical protein